VTSPFEAPGAREVVASTRPGRPAPSWLPGGVLAAVLLLFPALRLAWALALGRPPLVDTLHLRALHCALAGEVVPVVTLVCALFLAGYWLRALGRWSPRLELERPLRSVLSSALRALAWLYATGGLWAAAMAVLWLGRDSADELCRLGTSQPPRASVVLFVMETMLWLAYVALWCARRWWVAVHEGHAASIPRSVTIVLHSVGVPIIVALALRA
jgi:hypothetical protein